MKYLPLFPDTRTAVELEKPCAVPSDTCGSCKGTQGMGAVVPVAVGPDAGDVLLVVGEQVTLYEHKKLRAFTSDTNRSVVEKIREGWPGPVILDTAVRCPTSDGKAVDKCRKHLAQTIADVKPVRILCLGPRAAQAVLGRKVDGVRLRGNHAALSNGVPVFTVADPATAGRNRFLRKWLYEDIVRALTASINTREHSTAEAAVIETSAEAREASIALRRGGRITFDVETAGLMFDPSFRVVSIAFRSGDGSPPTYVFRLLGNGRGEGGHEEYIREILTSPNPKVGQNVKYDLLAVKAGLGYWPVNVTTDTRLLRKAIDAESPGDLDSMLELVGLGGSKEEHEAEKKRVIKEFRKDPSKAGDLAFLVDSEYEPEKWVYAFTDESIANRYVARDTYGTAVLAQHLRASAGAEATYLDNEILAHVPRAFAQMEYWGVPVDREAVANLESLLLFEEGIARHTLDSLGNGVDWNSHQQIASFLYGTLNLPIISRTDKGAPCTDAETLELLNERHPHDALTALLEYRRISKLRGTYATGLRAHIRPDGRIHPTILPDGARSGRTSCVDPNLQNIPRPDTREGKMVRDLFVSGPGRVLVELDYSQLELRIAAMLSQDPVMLGIYAEGVDFHQRTAELISQVAWKIPPDKVEGKHRTWAKTVNFGMLYGKTAATFAKEFGITQRQAQAIIDAIMGQFKTLAAWKRGALGSARTTGEAWTVWNGRRARRRPLWRIGSAMDAERITAENGAANSPIQGTASDYCVRSIIGIVEWILAEGIPAKLILAVHDSIMLEVDEDYVDEVIAMCRNIMEGWPTQGVKLKADVKVGRAWGSLEKRT